MTQDTTTPKTTFSSIIKTKLTEFRGISSKELLTLSVVAVVSIIEGVINSLTVIWNYVYKDDFSLSPAQASIFATTLNVPWIIKPIWGLLSDNIPLFGYKRKSYLIVMTLFGFVIVFAFGIWEMGAALGFALLFILNSALSTQTVVAQAIVAEKAQELNNREDVTEEQKKAAASRGVSIVFASKYIGNVVYALITTFLLTEDLRHVFLFYTSFSLLPVVAVSFFLPEQRVKTIRRNTTQTENLINVNVQQSNLRKTWEFIKIPFVYKSMLLIFLSNFTPAFDQANFYFYTNYLGFDASFLSLMSLAASVAIVLAIVVYNMFFVNTNLRTFFAWSVVLFFILRLSGLILILRLNVAIGIPDEVFAAIDQFATLVSIELNFMPMLVLSCRICPKNIEATIFSLMLGINNVSYVIANEMGGGIVGLLGITSTNFDNLWITPLIGAAFQLLPFLILWRIDFDEAFMIVEQANRQESKQEEMAEQIEQVNKTQQQSEEVI